MRVDQGQEHHKYRVFAHTVLSFLRHKCSRSFTRVFFVHIHTPGNCPTPSDHPPPVVSSQPLPIRFPSLSPRPTPIPGSRGWDFSVIHPLTSRHTQDHPRLLYPSRDSSPPRTRLDVNIPKVDHENSLLLRDRVPCDSRTSLGGSELGPRGIRGTSGSPSTRPPSTIRSSTIHHNPRNEFVALPPW